MQLFLSLIFALLFGSACAYLAPRKNRDPFAWFIIGMLLGIFALVLLYFLPPVEKESAEPEIEIKTTPVPKLLPLDYQQKEWFYITPERTQAGPISFQEIQNFKPDTLVWCEGMSDWKPLGEVLSSE